MIPPRQTLWWSALPSAVQARGRWWLEGGGVQTVRGWGKNGSMKLKPGCNWSVKIEQTEIPFWFICIALQRTISTSQPHCICLALTLHIYCTPPITHSPLSLHSHYWCNILMLGDSCSTPWPLACGSHGVLIGPSCCLADTWIMLIHEQMQMLGDAIQGLQLIVTS